MPESYAPPVQRQPFENVRPAHSSRIVNMSDGDADAHIVRDITGASGDNWRWVNQSPAVRVTVSSSANLRYFIDFTIPDVTFKETGPVSISFSVNDHVLDQARYATPGPHHFEKTVRAEWIDPGKDTILGASVDKVWTAPGDGAHLGFILTRIGLKQE